MRIKKDLKNYLDENLKDIATSHIESWKDRYFGYSILKLKLDLQLNHDDRADIESIENELGRKLQDHEKESFCEKFHKEIIKQYKDWAE